MDCTGGAAVSPRIHARVALYPAASHGPGMRRASRRLGGLLVVAASVDERNIIQGFEQSGHYYFQVVAGPYLALRAGFGEHPPKRRNITRCRRAQERRCGQSLRRGRAWLTEAGSTRARWRR